MKILLLNPSFLPRYTRASRSPCVARGGTFYYPYFLAYACGVLEKNGFDGKVKLVDAVANEWDHKKTVRFVKFFAPNLVVIDTSTPSIYNDIEVATKIKKALPKVHINLVGTHPTRVTDETFGLSKAIDSICRDEYDYTLVDLAKAIEKGKPLKGIKGLSFRKDGKIIHNEPRERIKNLDELPFVSEVYEKHFGIGGIKRYFYASLKHPQVTILTARGCPFNCLFCNIPFKASYRARSPKNVIEEFEYIQTELPEVNEVMIEDDTFPISKERTLKVCKLLKERGIKLTWSCNARVNTDLETLKAMKESGCRLLCVGFESPVQSVLDEVHKKTTAEMQIKFMNDCRKVGLLVNGCFILGMPGDTKETIRETIEFAKKLNPDTAQFYSAYAYPGTEMWDWAKENGYLTSERYDALLTEEGYHKGNINLPDLPAEEVDRLCREALKEFYLRKDYIFYKLSQIITNFDEARRTLMSGRFFFKHILLPQPQAASP
ncbi:MAG: radical SAM protein [Candidatus Aenigmarchaeota archaeon]|nr:radical SAM protein [Candidatus Aenigmarchaeota archaeon]